MNNSLRVVRVVIDSSGAKKGAQEVNQALSSIGAKANQATGANDNFASSMGRASAQSSKLNRVLEQQSGSMGKLYQLFRGASGEMGTFGAAADGAASKVETLGGTFRGLAGLGTAGVVAGIAAGFVALGAAGISAAAQVEKFKANLTTVTGSTQAAEAAYAGLVQFANKTPFTLDQSVEGFTKLRALGLSTSEDIMMSYGNTAAAMGKSMSQMIEAVADATTGEFERLKEFGIKAKQSGDQVAFTFQGVTTTVGRNASEIEKYLIGIGQNQFGGAMARQMDTLNGAFSNLEDKIFTFLADMGDGAFGNIIKDMVNGLANGLSAIQPLFSGIMDFIAGIINMSIKFQMAIADAFMGGADGAKQFQGVLDGLGVVFSFIGETASTLGSIAGQVFGFLIGVARTTASAIGDAFSSLFGWMIPSFSMTGQSAGESLVGILRAAQFVAGKLPEIFKTALNELKAAFGQLGAAIAAALTGDFSKFKDINLSFSGTKKIAGQTITGAAATYNDQKANRSWIDQRLGKKADGNIDFAGGGTGNMGNSKGSKGKKDTTADKLGDFWKGLEQELELSRLSTQEAEKKRKEFELQKILGREINAQERTRLTTLIDQTKAAQYMTKAAEDHRTKMIDLNTQEAILAARLKGETGEQLAITTAVAQAKADAQKSGIKLSGTELQTLIANTTEEARRNAEIAKRNKMLDDALGLAEKYSPTYNAEQFQKNAQAQVEALRLALDNGRISKAVYDEIIAGMDKASKNASAKMYDDWGSQIARLGDDIGGKWGSAIGKVGQMIQQMAKFAQGDFSGGGTIGAIANLLGSKYEKQPDGTFKKQANAFGEAFATKNGTMLNGIFSGSTWSKPFASMGESLKGLKEAFSGPNGSFMKGLGGLLGTMSAGAGIGSTVAGLGNALGLKMSDTGAQIGGAVGSFLGPIGSIVGSIAGGLLGGLFKKVKSGYAQVRDSAVTGTYGRTGEFQTQAAEMATSLLDNFRTIADKLDTTLGKVSFDIGRKDDKFGFTGGGQSTQWFSSETEAVKAALKYIISVGAFEGISESVKRLISTGDIEAQLEKAVKFQNVFKELKSLKDPLGFAVSNINTEFKKLTAIFKEAGASASEYASLEELRQLKLKNAFEDQTKGFTEFLKALRGDGSGRSKLSLLNEDLAKLQGFRNDIASGKAIDQNAFTELGKEIMGYASELYGTQTGSFQNIKNQLITLSEQALANATNSFNSSADPATAINDQTTQLTAQGAITNAYLAQIAASLQGIGLSPSYAAGVVANVAAVNGQLLTYN